MKLSVLSCAALFASLLGPARGQGPLTPPGAPGATQKTLQQIEPRVDLLAATPGPGVSSDATNQYLISQPGSYYLSGNLAVTKATGIHIAAAGVTLDLGGFTVSAEAAAAKTGIQIDPGASHSAVLHGNVSAGGAKFTNGVTCRNSVAPTTLYASYINFRDLVVSGCSGVGCIGGNYARFESCTFTGNLSGIGSFGNAICSHCISAENSNYGFDAGVYVSFEDCVADSNGGTGFHTYEGSSYIDCKSTSNGSIGFALTGYGVVKDCHAENNQDDGIFLIEGGTLSNCISISNTGLGYEGNEMVNLSHCLAESNTGGGFLLADQANLTACSALGNGGTSGSITGIACGGHAVLVDCISDKNSGTGILTGSDSSLAGCGASGNGAGSSGSGISAGDRCTVKDCQVVQNKNDGILATTDCVLTGNHASLNAASGSTTAGIRVSGSECRVEGNTVVENNFIGISAEGNRNFIARNTARNNGSNFVIVAGNRMAQILVPAINAAAVTGANSGSSDGFTDADPWANFSY